VSLLWLEIAGAVALATDKDEERHGNRWSFKINELIVRETKGKWFSHI
jgi:hypothetical protein